MASDTSLPWGGERRREGTIRKEHQAVTAPQTFCGSAKCDRKDAVGVDERQTHRLARSMNQGRWRALGSLRPLVRMLAMHSIGPQGFSLFARELPAFDLDFGDQFGDAPTVGI